MELVNGLPAAVSLNKRGVGIRDDEEFILLDNGGVVVATLRQDRNFSDAFNKALGYRYNVHTEIVAERDRLKEEKRELVEKLDNLVNCDLKGRKTFYEAQKEASALLAKVSP